MKFVSSRPWAAGLAAAALVLLAGCSSGPADKALLGTQKNVDLARYVGLWYEQARLPNRFQDQCVGDVQAMYELMEQGLRVTNRCRTASGQFDEAKAFGRLAPDAEDPARLQVRFAPQWMSWLPWVWGDYWILRVDGDYDYALVGTPDREYLWVLSRKPQADEARIQSLLDYAASQGFDIAKVRRTPQSPG